MDQSIKQQKRHWWARIGLGAVALACSVPAALAQGAAQPGPAWHAVGERDGETLYYSDDDIQGSVDLTPDQRRLTAHSETVMGRSVLRGRADGLAMSMWRRDFNCLDGTVQLATTVTLTSDGRIVDAADAAGPAGRPAAGSAEARLATIACARDLPGAPPPAYSGGNDRSPDFVAVEREMTRRCAAKGRRHMRFIPDTIFGVDADLDGDQDDFILLEGTVECRRADADEDFVQPCDTDCRTFLFIDDESGLHRVWAGTDPGLSGMGMLAAQPASAGPDAPMRAVRWDGHGFVTTNDGMQGDEPRSQIEPDGIPGAARILFPIRVECRETHCSWMRERARQALPIAGAAGERLVSLTMELGVSDETAGEYPDFYAASVGAHWPGLTNRFAVFCSPQRPAVLRQGQDGWHYRRMSLPGAIGADGGATRLYVAVCHPGVKASDADAVRRLGYSGAAAAGPAEGVVRSPEEIIGTGGAAASR
jgi:hypothetical protein